MKTMTNPGVDPGFAVPRPKVVKRGPGARLLLGALATVIASGALLVAHRAQGEGQVQPRAITFFVYCHSAKGLVVARKGVDVTRLDGKGYAHLGFTNGQGEFVLGQQEIAPAAGRAILFCEPTVPELCAAVRVDSDFIKGFAEFSVHLPLVETIDRMPLS